MNFIAFRFTDNDFHTPLRESIEYIRNNSEYKKISLETWREYTLRGLVAFNSLRNISDFSVKQRDNRDLRPYFEKTLTVSGINRLSEIDTNRFEGYIIDLHTGTVFYQGY
jgi:hypothetical protein